MWSMILQLLGMMGQQSSAQPGSTNMQALSSFKEGGGPGGMLGGQGYAGKGTYGNTGKSVAANLFDPGGFIRPGGDEEEEPTLEEQLDRMMNWERSQPEYQAYSGELDKIGEDPNYGAIQPDWGEIWDNVSTKIGQNFWGSPTGPGVADKMRASVARRGVEDSPAEAELLSRLGAEQGNQLKDLGVQQNQQRTSLVEAARRDYLNKRGAMAGKSSVTNFADMLPMFMGDAMGPQADNSMMEGLGGSMGDWFGGGAGAGPGRTVGTVDEGKTYGGARAYTGTPYAYSGAGLPSYGSQYSSPAPTFDQGLDNTMASWTIN